jgi:hypothetical protein
LFLRAFPVAISGARRDHFPNVKTIAPALLLALALAGCARAPQRSSDLDSPPSDEERLKETVDAAERGRPTRWSPLVTIPLSPVLLVVNTSIDVGKTTAMWFRDLLGGGSEDVLPVPERLERQADELQKN